MQVKTGLESSPTFAKSVSQETLTLHSCSVKPGWLPRNRQQFLDLSSQSVKKLLEELNLPIHEVVFYTDSKVALGYIQNDSRRFYVYVANRVQVIRSISDPTQWRYAGTTLNPADLTTREVTEEHLKDSRWLHGPEFLREASPNTLSTVEKIALDLQDPEFRRQVTTYTTDVVTIPGLGAERFSRFFQFHVSATSPSQFNCHGERA
ncbi:uncharacterized protein LOC111344420 [Stylophora pistillata]|nr:uncharacterized protein LOC111344420 [Stylophora pistillata]